MVINGFGRSTRKRTVRLITHRQPLVRSPRGVHICPPRHVAFLPRPERVSSQVSARNREGAEHIATLAKYTGADIAQYSVPGWPTEYPKSGLPSADGSIGLLRTLWFVSYDGEVVPPALPAVTGF